MLPCAGVPFDLSVKRHIPDRGRRHHGLCGGTGARRRAWKPTACGAAPWGWDRGRRPRFHSASYAQQHQTRSLRVLLATLTTPLHPCCHSASNTQRQIFFSVYEMAIDTTLLSFCEDSESHGGHPRFAPPLLMEAINEPYPQDSDGGKHWSRR